jgi:hypothetical protein
VVMCLCDCVCVRAANEAARRHGASLLHILNGFFSSRNDRMAPVDALYVTKPVSPLGPGPSAMYLRGSMQGGHHRRKAGSTASTERRARRQKHRRQDRVPEAAYNSLSTLGIKDCILREGRGVGRGVEGASAAQVASAFHHNFTRVVLH